MLDILLSRLKEEIAIDGSSGSSIDTVWSYVESISKDIAKNSGASIEPLIDDKYKSFIWNYLKSEKDLEFYENIASQQKEISEAPNEIMDTEEGAINDNSESTVVPNTDNSDVTMTEAAPVEVLDMLLEIPPRKRKQPPKSKKKSASKKKARSKSKPKKKTAPKKKVVVGDSDEDFDGGESSESSGSESDFEDESESNDSEDDVTEDESEDYDSEEENTRKKSKQVTIAKQPKSASTKPTKAAVKATLNRINGISSLTYEQVTETYDDRLYITGSLELQEQQLYAGIPPGPPMSSNLVIILQEIIRTRSKGLYQANVTKILDIDSRSTGHYCKSLEEKGAIVRNGVSTNKMRTNVCMHVRFAAKNHTIEIDDEDSYNVPYNVNSKGKAYSQTMLRDSLIDLVKDAPGMAILAEDVLRALGFDYSRKSVRKWFNRTIDELCGKGYIKKSNVKVNNQGKLHRCIHLVRLPEKSLLIETPIQELEYPIRIKSLKKEIPILHVLVDTTVESQCLQVLIAAGTNGATQKELAFALNMDEHRILYKLLEKMCELTGVGLERFGAMRLLEFEGKQRRYRYYTYTAYKKLHENIDVDLPPLPEQDMDESELFERNYFIDIPHSAKEYKKYLLAVQKSKTDLHVFSAMGRKADRSNSVVKIGRPRKHPLPSAEGSPAPTEGSTATALSLVQEGMNPDDIEPGRSIMDVLNGSAFKEPKKKGRPKKSATASGPALPKSPYTFKTRKPKGALAAERAAAERAAAAKQTAGNFFGSSATAATGEQLTAATEGSSTIANTEGVSTVARIEGPSNVAHIEGPSAAINTEGVSTVARIEGPSTVATAEGSSAVASSTVANTEEPTAVANTEEPTAAANTEGSSTVTDMDISTTTAPAESITDPSPSAPASLVPEGSNTVDAQPTAPALDAPTASESTTTIPKKRGRPKKATAAVNAEIPKKTRYSTRSSDTTTAPVESVEKETTAAPVTAESATVATTNTEAPIEAMEVDETIVPVTAATNIPAGELTANVTVTPSETVIATTSTAPMDVDTPAPASSKKRTKASQKNAAPPVAPARSLRKRTIFDYFAKAPHKITDTPATNDSPVASAPLETSSSDKQAVDLTETPSEVTPTTVPPAPSETVNVILPTESPAVPELAAAEELAPAATEEEPAPVTVYSASVESNKGTAPTTNEAQPAPVEPSSSATNEVAPTASVPENAVEPSNAVVVAKPTISGPPTSRLMFKKGATHNRPNQINIYMEARMRILLAVLEDKPMWDMGKELVDEYTRKATQLSGLPKYVVCNKTLWRSACELNTRGEAKTDYVECPLYNGKSIRRKVLVHKDVDLEGEEYQKYKTFLKERRALTVSYGPIKKYEDVDMPVERLEDRLDRMKEELQGLLDNEKTVEAKLLQNRIDELSVNVDQFKPKTNDTWVSSWMITAVQFGWIRARMVRIKMIYQYMFDLMMMDELVYGVDKEGRYVSTHAIISNMPISLLCQAIGIFNPVDPVIQFLRDPNNANLTMKTMPDNIRGELFSDKNKFRRRLRTLFFGMEFLDLVVADYGEFDAGRNTGKYANLGDRYHLCRTVAIREIKKLGQPVLREHTLDTSADVTLYWSELQYVSTKLEEDIPEEEREPPPTHPVALQFWGGLHNFSNWSTANVYSARQRKKLNSFVDKINGTTPRENYTICLRIASELDLTLASVRAYFTKVEDALARKSRNSEMRKLERRLYPVTRKRKTKKLLQDYRAGSRVINLSSTRAFRAPVKKLPGLPESNVGSDSTATIEYDNKIISDQRAKGENLFLDNLVDAPVLSSYTNKLTRTRTSRTPWTPQEDELLIYSQTILRQRATHSRFYWAAILQVFPTKSISQCRHRHGKLIQNAKYVEQMEIAAGDWAGFYEEGLRHGDIQDPDPYDMFNFDLLALLSYFLKRLNENEPSTGQIIPNDINLLRNQFDIVRGADSSNYYFEDQYRLSKSLVSKTAAISHQSLSVRKFNDNENDTSESVLTKENQVDQRYVKLIKTYAMMCLLTPKEKFDPFFSYSVLRLFPKDIYDQSIQELRDEGTLVLNKNQRPVPGTRFTLSSRFHTMMAGKLPENLFEQAKEYDKYLNHQPGKSRFIPDVVSSGMMACMLDLMSNFKLNVTMANKTLQMERLEDMAFASRLTDRSLTVLELDIEKAESEDLTADGLSPGVPHTKEIDEDEFKFAFTGFLRRQDKHMQSILQQIVELLEERKDLGLTLYELKMELKRLNDDGTIKRAIRLLESNDPALICHVGFEAGRYILAPYTETWTIHTKGISTQEFSAKAKNKANEYAENDIDSIVKQEAIITNLWTDMNGDTTDVVLKDCKAVLVDYILRTPGTSEANIHRHFSQAFDRKPLHDLLDILVKQNVLKKVQIYRPSTVKKSIFAKPRTFKCTSENLIEKTTQSCYWVTSCTYRSVTF